MGTVTPAPRPRGPSLTATRAAYFSLGLFVGVIVGMMLAGPAQNARRAPVSQAAAPASSPTAVLAGSTTPSTASSPIVIPPQPTQAPRERGLEIVSIDSRITESNDVWARHAWKLTIRNLDAVPHVFSATIKFLDGDQFLIDEDNAFSLHIGPNREELFTGYDLISQPAGGRVENVHAEVSWR